MLGLLLRSPQRRATSSGSVILNSPLVPSHVMQLALELSESSSRRNCHSWICPLPARSKPERKGNDFEFPARKQRQRQETEGLSRSVLGTAPSSLTNSCVGMDKLFPANKLVSPLFCSWAGGQIRFHNGCLWPQNLQAIHKQAFSWA